MTIEYALEIIDKNGWGYPENEVIEAHKLIDKEMSYRTGKPPLGRIHRNDTGGLFDQGVCPSCGELVHETERYCSYCGQLLDWSDMIKCVKLP